VPAAHGSSSRGPSRRLSSAADGSVRPELKLLALAGAVILVVVGAFAVTRERSEDPDDRQPAVRPPASVEQPEAPSFLLARGSNIYVIDVATRSADRITTYDDETVSDPSWSAEGEIVFSENPPGKRPRLVVVKPDGSNERKVPKRIRQLMQPTWAPDGRRIAAVWPEIGIQIADLRTGSVRRLRATGAGSSAPAWSPDGRTIVFQAPAPGTLALELYRVSATNGVQTRLTRDHLQQSDPAWAPDGSRLVFAEQQRNGNWALVTTKLDGSDREQLTDDRYSSQQPSWSPDGKKIAFALQGGGRGSLAIVDAAGGPPVPVSRRSLVAISHPAWSPDSKKIAFVGRRGQRPPPAPPPGGPVIPRP
jgi:Tol biopolymer transport system component